MKQTKPQIITSYLFVITVFLFNYLTPNAYAADRVEILNAKLSKLNNGDQTLLDRTSVRALYLENVRIKSHGVDFLNGCKAMKINKHALLSTQSSPAIRYKGISIVGSPYYSAPVKTNKDNNSLYFKRLKLALDIIEKHKPQAFAAIVKTMAQHRGYVIIDNFCPSNGGLAFAAFIPRPKHNNFVVMVSSTLLLLPDMFSDYDVASQLVHEMEGHAVDYYGRGTTDEAHAFTKQAEFAATVGGDKFIDVNNRHANLKMRVKMKLSSKGTYVESKSN